MIDLVYEASTPQELLEAIRQNPDINEISANPYYRRATAFQHFLDNVVDYRPNYIVFTHLKVLPYDDLIEMVRIFVRNGVNLDNTLYFVVWSNMSEKAKIAVCKILLDAGASMEEIRPKDNYLYLAYNMTSMPLLYYTERSQQNLHDFLERGYRLEKIRDNYCATKIQNWFLKKYYDPYHPYGKARLEREFTILAELFN
jgi:hypothetical protein